MDNSAIGFPSPFGEFYRDMTNPAHLSGLCKNMQKLKKIIT